MSAPALIVRPTPSLASAIIEPVGIVFPDGQGGAFGFYRVIQPAAANDRVSCCSDCGRQAGDVLARACRQSGCPLHHETSLAHRKEHVRDE